MHSSRIGLALMAALAGAGISAVAVDSGVKAVIAAPPSKRAERRNASGGNGSPSISVRRPGPGWTHAQVQRMAKKRRNVLKHRARCRRAR